MADTILGSLRGASSSFNSGAKQVVDLFGKRGYVSTGDKAFELIQENNDNVSFGNKIYFTVKNQPAGTYMGSPWLQFDVNDPSIGNYNKDGALGFISHVRMLHGKNVLLDYDYDAPMNLILRTMDNDRAAQYFNAATSGQSPVAAGGVFCVPLPTFYSNLINMSPATVPMAEPLPLDVPGEIKFEITLRPAADVVASGGTAGTLNSVEFVYPLYVDAAPKASGPDYFYKSIAWIQDTGSVAMTTATSTTNNMVNFGANVRRLLIAPRTQTNLNTNNSYFDVEDLTALQIRINTKEYINWSDPDDTVFRMLNLLLSDVPNYGDVVDAGAASINHGATIDFCIDPADAFSYSSSLNTIDTTKPIQVVATQASGATCDLFVVAEIDSIYKKDRSGYYYRDDAGGGVKPQ